MPKQRSTIEYNLNQLKIIEKETNILVEQIEVKSLKYINKIHENQNKCGRAVRNIFNNPSIINCLVYGMTQTGKTGCMTSIINHFMLSNNIQIDNIYIITGLSDIEWKKDTKYRMPDSINSRVFHRANLHKTFVEDIKSKKNILIIMDEIHIACTDKQTINKIFEECKFYNLDYLLENDIKFVQFSATPDGNINDIFNWKHHSAIVKLDPGHNYYGPKQAIEQNRVKQFKDLTNEDNVKELKYVIDNNYTSPRYYLIRVPNKKEDNGGNNNQLKVISNIKNVFGENYVYNEEYLKEKKDDINKILEIQPEKHTFIFYCEILRCAKTQYKKYIGISYERYIINPCDSSIIQGSFGRLTGYGDNGDSICYTNIQSLENYIKLWENDMSFKEGIIWNTKTTKYCKKDNITNSSAGTFNSVKYIDQLNENLSSENDEETIEPIIKKFYGEKGQSEMISWFKKNLKEKMPEKRGPNKKKINDDGFYHGSIRKGLEILSTEKVYKERKWGFSKGNGIRSYPCYSNISDKNTLEWWFIYYDK